VKVLALETSTLAGGAALLDGARIVGEYTLDIRVTHSERLLVAVDRLLADAGWRAVDLDGVAVAVGPGSFTGLRIGVSTAKGLGLALGLPIAPVPTLDALANGFPFAAIPVLPVLEARRGEVYASYYRWRDGGMRREWEYLAVSPAELARRLTEPVALCGDGAGLIDSPFARMAPAARRLPSPASVAELGHALLVARRGVSVAELAPIYVRPSEAELARRGAGVLA
jgi:tRNA threonylcarbamoyladenosine biosynthesis protein TsaB